MQIHTRRGANFYEGSKCPFYLGMHSYIANYNIIQKCSFYNTLFYHCTLSAYQCTHLCSDDPLLQALLHAYGSRIS